MSGAGEKGPATTKTPADFLKSIRGRPVVVKLNSGVDYRGILACLDGYMNIAMEQTEEYVNGQLKNKYGDAFIRGNNEFLSACSALHQHIEEDTGRGSLTHAHKRLALAILAAFILQLAFLNMSIKFPLNVVISVGFARS
ncbi:sm-like protein LSM36B [Capsicum chacoense]